MSTTPAERFDDKALVKGTMLRAHLSWAAKRFGAGWEPARLRLPEAVATFLVRPILPTDWIPFATLITIDRAIAEAAGGEPAATWLALGRHSAALNLTGVYKSFISGEPHRFFDRMTVLHHQFQTFGKSAYERSGESAGRIRIETPSAFSPVYCISGKGYYEEALRLLQAPGPIVVRESSCATRGATSCIYELAW